MRIAEADAVVVGGRLGRENLVASRGPGTR
jgi:hypothetical protein